MFAESKDLKFNWERTYDYSKFREIRGFDCKALDQPIRDSIGLPNLDIAFYGGEWEGATTGTSLSIEGRGIRGYTIKGNDDLFIHVGNFENGKREGWGLEIILLKHKQYSVKNVKSKLGMWVGDVYNLDATKEADV